jgi:hypothetical protein
MPKEVDKVKSKQVDQMQSNVTKMPKESDKVKSKEADKIKSKMAEISQTTCKTEITQPESKRSQSKTKVSQNKQAQKNPQSKEQNTLVQSAVKTCYVIIDVVCFLTMLFGCVLCNYNYVIDKISSRKLTAQVKLPKQVEIPLRQNTVDVDDVSVGPVWIQTQKWNVTKDSPSSQQKHAKAQVLKKHSEAISSINVRTYVSIRHEISTTTSTKLVPQYIQLY